MTSDDVTGLALLFNVMLLCLIHESVRVLYTYVYVLSREMSGRTPIRPQGRAMRRIDL